MASYNVAIVGQTGVGKSSLINYLYGDKIAETGVGMPVTTNGFHAIKTEINGLSVTLFDSWGLEVGKANQWLEELERELKNRGVDQPADKWFHSVFYCVQAGGGRFQPADSQIIRKFISENYNVSVILTKCDQISEEEENLLRDAIKKEIAGVEIISVCSVEKKTRAGISEAFGRVEVKNKAFEDFFNSLINRLPLRCEDIMRKMKVEWEAGARTLIDEVNIGGFNEGDIRKKLLFRTEEIQKALFPSVRSEIDATLKMYGDFSKKLGYPPISSIIEKGKEHRFFQKKESSFEWYEVPVAVALAPVAIVWGLLFAKSSYKEDLHKEVNKIASQMDDYIQTIKYEVKSNLIEMKKRVTQSQKN